MARNRKFMTKFLCSIYEIQTTPVTTIYVAGKKKNNRVLPPAANTCIGKFDTSLLVEASQSELESFFAGVELGAYVFGAALVVEG